MPQRALLILPLPGTVFLKRWRGAPHIPPRRRKQVLAALEAAQEVCFRFRVEPAGPAWLAEKIDGEGGFAQPLDTSRAAGGQMFGHSASFIGA